MEQTRLLELIEKSREGDRQAQEELVVATQDRVYYHCKKMLKNEQDALDATQDVLIAMLTGLDKLKVPAAFFGWVNGITANRCKHLLTQGVTEWQIPEDEEGHGLLETLETLDEASVPHEVLDNAETRRLMLGIIDDLPPAQRMTVLFYYYDEMSVGEIAEAMGVSRGTAMSRLNYARKSIKTGVEKLEKQGTKLYGLSPLPLLLLFLRREAAQGGLTAAQGARITVAALSGGAGAATGAAGAGVVTAGGKVAMRGSAKAIAVTLAGTLVVGSLGTVTYLVTRSKPEPTPASALVVAAISPASTPRPASAPVLEPSWELPVSEEPTPEPSLVPEATEEPAPEPSPIPEATKEPVSTGEYRTTYHYIQREETMWTGEGVEVPLDPPEIVILDFNISGSDLIVSSPGCYVGGPDFSEVRIWLGSSWDDAVSVPYVPNQPFSVRIPLDIGKIFDADSGKATHIYTGWERYSIVTYPSGEETMTGLVLKDGEIKMKVESY